MVSPVDGPGSLPVSYLPVPTGGRSLVPYARGDGGGDQTAGRSGPDRPDRPVSEAVAVPLGASEGRRPARDNPFLQQSEDFRRPLLAGGPPSPFLAQSIGQDGTPGTRTSSSEAAGRYRTVQETVDRAATRRSGPPGVDVVA